MKRAANGGRDAFLLCIGDERTQKLDSGAALGRLLPSRQLGQWDVFAAIFPLVSR